MQSAKHEFLHGIKDELPILVGVIPFGMIYGILALGAGLSEAEAQAMSVIVFAGSAQFMLVQLAGIGTPALVMIVTGFVINLRHALYSASVAPHVRKLPPLWKGILAYLLTDEAYAVAITRYYKRDASPLKHWYFLGAGLALWTSWQISSAVGIFLGTQVPSSWSLDFTLALTFIALVVPALKDRPSVLAALSAGIVAILSAGLPYKLNLIVAAIVGIIVGLWSEGNRNE
ncbi:MAG: AzlC family ABC transporter permease [Anaerolineae bacterium]|nr:AzlC family ABC transporter permease [Anaerolineae bacterium]MBT7071244.1 AzlC family ABC transporter permease [Anaerolineae bacterium]MBT7324173.1 AzlC family ABC transporter permease [Anaerolineae bacterium]